MFTQFWHTSTITVYISVIGYVFPTEKNISAQNTLTIMSQKQSNCPKIRITSLATPRGTIRNCFYSCDCFRLPLIGPQGKVTTFTNNSTHSVHSESCHLLKQATSRPHNYVYADWAVDSQQVRTAWLAMNLIGAIPLCCNNIIAKILLYFILISILGCQFIFHTQSAHKFVIYDHFNTTNILEGMVIIII
jgi:hypothetical protein